MQVAESLRCGGSRLDTVELRLGRDRGEPGKTPAAAVVVVVVEYDDLSNFGEWSWSGVEGEEEKVVREFSQIGGGMAVAVVACCVEEPVEEERLRVISSRLILRGSAEREEPRPPIAPPPPPAVDTP